VTGKFLGADPIGIRWSQVMKDIQQYFVARVGKEQDDATSNKNKTIINYDN
jgi:hypothetical protein